VTARASTRRQDLGGATTFTDSAASGTVVLPDLHRLRAFVVVAEELNFHHAAARLNMTQSPLSRVIKKLEGELGVALFHRSRHRVTLTAAGQCLVPQARALLDFAAQVLSGVRGLSPPAVDELGRRRADRHTAARLRRFPGTVAPQ
jgi:DNA-binding transcriptional LysR family regulator